MKYILFTLITALGVSTHSFGQNFQGIATYQTATSLDMKLDSTSMTPEQQQMIMQMLKKQMQKEFELSFNKTESVYKEVEQLDKQPGMGFMSMLSGVEGVLYKNLQSGLSSRQTEFFSKLFLVRDTLEKKDWKLGKETKQIGSYTCYKATVIQPVTSKIFSGEENEDGSHTKEVVDTVEMVAWYTPQIPVSHGPASFWGLPGLIMEVQDGKTAMLCSKVVLNPKKELKIEEPTEGEEVTREEFEKIADDKIKEMERMYGGGRSGRGGGSMKIQITR
ncbi:MAG TPA: GLPGLI family protein [Cryomorphaceae bacterium]|nr:GLPGLI family protein [Owenweeksia sp.]HAD96771.1 GLPGLI family protein [Cryomorphaceae bacterium]HBF19441.1 GLPGLI family protein [Cryomorphaceae bacterium]HCQ15558.1 GLPGLI family protein [Cryomorphaceae bacterium]|tara:strand:- start:923 stop:1750 length:828 start_codon:yes stop_codon:yes gene_type:complete